MTEQFVLLVSSKEKGFLSNSMKEALTKEGIASKIVPAGDMSINEYINMSFGVMIIDCNESPLIMQPIKHKCYELGKKVILYGSSEELDSLKRIFIDSMIYREYVRPAVAEDVVQGVRKLYERVQRQSIMKNILVVDDNGVLLRTIMTWLEGKYSVTLANSAARAMEAIRKSIPDLILLDYEMPICSGAEFMKILANEDITKDIPVIFLTSRSDAATVREVMELKPKGYILKTTPQEQLLNKIAEYFDSIED